jgi:Tfp pilus assembly protein PilX
MTRRLRQEDGFALLLALGITIVLAILVTSMISYTSSGQRAAQLSTADGQAAYYGEGGTSAAYSMLVKTNSTLGGNPTAANLLGCAGATGAADINGPSNCTGANLVPKVICITTASCASGDAGSATTYGFFSGNNPTNFPTGCTTGAAGCTTVPASTWLINTTGYARNPAGTIDAKTTTGLVTISAATAGAVAAVWNHVFVTSPLVAGQCSLDFSGNNIAANVPIYVIGNFCLGGSTIDQSTMPIDVMVGGYLYINGGHVGSAGTPITSGIVTGGCSSSTNGSGATPCTNGSWNWHVAANDTFISRDAPEVSATDIASDYANFDPGPSHPCASGSNPYAPLASSVFDNNATQNNSAGTFTLTPGSNYTCNSVSGSSVGQLQWNNTTKVLTINGNVFIDGSLLINQALTYTGTGVIELAGTITISGNGTTVCAVANCTATNWQGTSGNNQMLTLASLATNTTAITFVNNAETFQGSLWTQPSSSMTFIKNGVTVQGPISIGKFDATFNNAVLAPLPVIKNMPTGAPLPPNTGVSIGPLVTTK